MLPVVGLCVGALSAFLGRPPTSPQAGFNATIVASVYGLAAGSALMTVVALGFLVARFAVRRFTVRSVLLIIASVALLLGAWRGCAR